MTLSLQCCVTTEDWCETGVAAGNTAPAHTAGHSAAGIRPELSEEISTVCEPAAAT